MVRGSETCCYRPEHKLNTRGFELFLLLSAWKLAYPRHVVLLRGNHESTTCTTFYGASVHLHARSGTPCAGFRNEVLAKYGPKDGKVGTGHCTHGMHGWYTQAVYQACKRVFSHLPLAALVAGRTLVLHGGLFRKPRKGPKKRKRWGLEPAGMPCGCPALSILVGAPVAQWRSTSWARCRT